MATVSGRLPTAPRFCPSDQAALSGASCRSALQSHDASNPVASAIDTLFAHETPAVRWLRLASAQLRASEEGK